MKGEHDRHRSRQIPRHDQSILTGRFAQDNLFPRQNLGIDGASPPYCKNSDDECTDSANQENALHMSLFNSRRQQLVDVLAEGVGILQRPVDAVHEQLAERSVLKVVRMAERREEDAGLLLPARLVQATGSGCWPSIAPKRSGIVVAVRGATLYSEPCPAKPLSTMPPLATPSSIGCSFALSATESFVCGPAP